MLKAAVAFGSVGIGSTTATTAWLKTDGSISRLTYEQANVSSVGWQYRTTACGGLEGLTSPFLRPSKSRRRRMHRPCEYRRETSVDDKCSAAFFCPTCRPATIVLGAVSPVHKWIARAPRSNYWMTDVRRTAKQPATLLSVRIRLSLSASLPSDAFHANTPYYSAANLSRSSAASRRLNRLNWFLPRDCSLVRLHSVALAVTWCMAGYAICHVRVLYRNG